MNRKLILCIAGSGLLLLGLGIITLVSHFYPEHLNNSEIFLSQLLKNIDLTFIHIDLMHVLTFFIRSRAVGGPQYVQG